MNISPKVKDMLINRSLAEQDKALRNKGVFARLDNLRDFFEAFKTQWNAANPTHQITATLYDPKDPNLD